MKTLNQDILDINIGIIVHAVNCKGTWGAGLAKSLKHKYPKAYDDYLKYLNFFKMPYYALGSISYTKIRDLYIVSVFTQYDVSVTQRRTEYSAVINAMDCLNNYIKINRLDLPLYFPDKICCGLGGGDWNIVGKIIEDKFPKAYLCTI